jgi:hypothetical protein
LGVFSNPSFLPVLLIKVLVKKWEKFCQSSLFKGELGGAESNGRGKKTQRSEFARQGVSRLKLLQTFCISSVPWRDIEIEAGKRHPLSPEEYGNV